MSREQDVEYYLDRFCTATRVTNGSVNLENFLVVQAIVEILSHLHAAHVEGQGIGEPDDIKRVVRKAVFRWRKYKNTNVQYFNRALKYEIDQFLDQPNHTFLTVLFLACRNNNLVPGYAYNSIGQDYHIRDLSEFRSHVDVSELEVQMEERIQRTDLYSLLPVTSECEARNARSALEKSLRGFDLHRALLNYRAGTFTMTFQNVPQPLGTVYPSPIYGVYDSNGSLAGSYYNIEKLTYTPWPIPDEQVERAARLSHELDGDEHSKTLDYLLVKVLLKYQDALDTITWSLAFLSLWQCLELAATSGRKNANLKHTQIVRNVSNLLSLAAPNDRLFGDLAESLATLRHGLVHTGEFTENRLYPVMLLRMVVETVILSLFNARSFCPEISYLEEFYSYSSRDNTTLNRKTDIIRTILERRDAAEN